MIRRDLLDGAIATAGISKAKLARTIGMTPKTFYGKTKTGEFRRSEIVAIVKECHIDQPIPIFFPELVTQHATT